MDRVILHSDGNSFFASVECVGHPELKTVPMAVCGDPEKRHGIILAKNDLAKRCGVQTAETIWRARQKCPELVLVPPHFEAYYACYKAINAIYSRYTDQVEPFSIDESWMDVTGSRTLFGDGKTIADALRTVVKAELGITISVGVSFNKVFAKLGSDYKKPDATTVIMRGDVERIVYPLPVTDLLFVGRSSAVTLERMGIFTIGDLARADAHYIASSLGKVGETIQRYARGEDTDPVRRFGDRTPLKSVGNGMTFQHDLVTPEEVRTGMTALTEEVAFRLRKTGQKAQIVHVQIKYPSLQCVSRQKRLTVATDLSREISRQALALIQQIWTPPRPIRAITVTVSDLTTEDGQEQLSFFVSSDEDERKKQKQLEETVDSLRERFGKTALRPLGILHNDMGIVTDNVPSPENKK